MRYPVNAVLLAYEDAMALQHRRVRELYSSENPFFSPQWSNVCSCAVETWLPGPVDFTKNFVLVAVFFGGYGLDYQRFRGPLCLHHQGDEYSHILFINLFRTSLAEDRPVLRPLLTQDNANIDPSTGIRFWDPSFRAVQDCTLINTSVTVICTLLFYRKGSKVFLEGIFEYKDFICVVLNFWALKSENYLT